MINNTPEIKLGIVAVSRDCFPNSLSENRRKAVVKAYDGEIYECPIIVENEIDMMNALEDLKKAECDALVVYLGNFGPETEETLLVKYFDGPCMVVAAAEETGDDLVGGRGDAYCGVLNASYNLKLRNLHAYIPEYPVGDAEDVAAMIKDFVPVATAVVAVKNLKIISFGPRPTNFLACNAPIKQLYNLGVEIEENSELDLFEAFNKHAGDERIPAVVEDMAKELGEGNLKPEILPKLAQYEITPHSDIFRLELFQPVGIKADQVKGLDGLDIGKGFLVEAVHLGIHSSTFFIIVPHPPKKGTGHQSTERNSKKGE